MSFCPSESEAVCYVWAQEARREEAHYIRTMMERERFFVSFCSFVLFSQVLAGPDSTGYLRREHSLFKPYQGSGMAIPNWDFRGNTFVSSNYIRLTPDHQSMQGGIWNNVACHLRDWEMVLHFKVHGSGTSLFGDGFALWYTRERMLQGSVFGSRDLFYGLGIFFDTYSNHNGEHMHEHPYMSAMIGNGSLPYDHDRDGTLSQVAGCSASFRGRDHETFALIRYSGSQEQLSVFVDVDDQNEWRECINVGGVKLPTGLYFGASAITGQLADNHDIISMKLYELDSGTSEGTDEGARDFTQIVPFASAAEAPRERVEDTKGSFSATAMKFFSWMFWLALIGCCLIGIFFYIHKKQQENSKKRFY